MAIGDTVRRGDVMAVVETEKSDIDIEIWRDGTVEEFLVELQREVPVGTPLIRLAESDTLDGPRQSLAVEVDVVRASPRARRLASERGVELAGLRGSGPGGAVVGADVLEPAVSPASARPAIEPLPTGQRRVASMRSVIAERMSKANRDIPHYYLQRDVDVTSAIRWLNDRNERRSISERILPAALYVRAVGLAAARHPEFNGHWIDDHFESGSAVNVAMAISLRAGGLVTPAISNTDRRSIDEVMTAFREIVAAARNGTLKGSWMSGSTITLTNLGDTGADVLYGVISPPEVALIGFGRTVQRPWVVDGDITIRQIITVTLAADHRATDGAEGSRFLATIAHRLEHPEEP